MGIVDREELIERTYEAAIVPDELADIARLSDCAGGSLFAIIGPSVRWTASEELVPVMTALVKEGWMTRNIRASRAAALDHAGFVTDLDLTTPEEREHHPFYTQLMHPYGFRWAVGTVIPVPTGDLLVYNIERRYEQGLVSGETVRLLDNLRPDLARAALMAARLHLRQAHALADALELIGLPAAVIRSTGQVVATNSHFDGLRAYIVPRSHGRLALVDHTANLRLEEAMRNAVAGHRGIRSVAVPGPDGGAAMVVHVMPICRSAHDILGVSDVILVAMLATTAVAPAADLLHALFDLTPAEAQVARALTHGESVAAVSRRTGVSQETVRTQVKAIFEKVGVSRQAELVGMLAMIGARSPRENQGEDQAD